MELYNFAKDFTFGDIKQTLASTPYNLKITEKSPIYPYPGAYSNCFIF